MQPEVLVNVAQLSSARRRTIICMVHLGQFRFFCICGLYHKHLLQFSMIYASRLSNLYVQQRFEGIFVISQDVYFSSQTSELEGLKTCLLRTGPLFSMNFILELIFSLSYLGHLLYHLITCAAIAMDFVFPGSMVAYSQVLVFSVSLPNVHGCFFFIELQQPLFVTFLQFNILNFVLDSQGSQNR